MTENPAEGGRRKIVANVALSIDGFSWAPDDGMGWLIEHATSEGSRAHFEGIYRGASTVLLGRTNYEGFFSFWPAVANDPAADPRDREFASWLDDVEKVAFSRTLTGADWSNSRIATDLEAEVRALKRAPGRDILVLSSASIIQALLRADLLDELRVTVLPSILGGGLRLFPDGLPASTWRLAGLTTFASGGVGLQYNRL